MRNEWLRGGLTAGELGDPLNLYGKTAFNAIGNHQRYLHR